VFLADFEEKVMEMIQNPASTIGDRKYNWVGRHLMYKPNKRNVPWRSVTLVDFSDAVGEDLWEEVDKYVRRSGGAQLVDMKLEIKLQCEPLQKAFPRNRSVNELSSPAPETPTQAGSRTKQLLAEARADARAEAKAQERVATAQAIRTATDHQAELIQRWRCQEPLCTNGGGLCYNPLGTYFHYAIANVDLESWAHKWLEGTNGVNQELPPRNLVEYWKKQGNKLKVNPNNRRKRRDSDSSSGSSSSSGDRKFTKQFKKMERQLKQSQLRRMMEDEEDRQERRQEQKLATQIQRAQLAALQAPHVAPSFPGYGHPQLAQGLCHGVALPATLPPAPPAVAAPSLAPPAYHTAPATPSRRVNLATALPTSSPVNPPGREDTRVTVKEFFQWLVNEQPDEDRGDYIETARVAIEQKWTINDLRQMSEPGGKLYTVAVSTFSLKDGIVRHFREDIRKYKLVHRAALDLSNLVNSEL
jgi:hypothetical protein